VAASVQSFNSSLGIINNKEGKETRKKKEVSIPH